MDNIKEGMNVEININFQHSEVRFQSVLKFDAMPGESFIIIDIEREFGQAIVHKKTNDYDDKNFSWKDIHGDTHKLTRIKEKFQKIDSETQFKRETEKIHPQIEQSQLHKELQMAKSSNLTLSKRIQELEMARNQVSDQKKSLEPDLNSETQTTKIPKVMVNNNEASDANDQIKPKTATLGGKKIIAYFAKIFK